MSKKLVKRVIDFSGDLTGKFSTSFGPTQKSVGLGMKAGGVVLSGGGIAIGLLLNPMVYLIYVVVILAALLIFDPMALLTDPVTLLGNIVVNAIGLFVLFAGSIADLFINGILFLFLVILNFALGLFVLILRLIIFLIDSLLDLILAILWYFLLLVALVLTTVIQFVVGVLNFVKALIFMILEIIIDKVILGIICLLVNVLPVMTAEILGTKIGVDIRSPVINALKAISFGDISVFTSSGSSGSTSYKISGSLVSSIANIIKDFVMEIDLSTWLGQAPPVIEIPIELEWQNIPFERIPILESLVSMLETFGLFPSLIDELGIDL